MWGSQHASFPQHKSSSSSTIYPFPGSQSGFASGCDNSAGSPSYCRQTPDNRFSSQGLTSSHDGLLHGSVHDFWSESNSNSSSIQHITPQHYPLQGANYNQSGIARTTLQGGAPPHVATGPVSLQTFPPDIVSAQQRRLYSHNASQDFLSALTCPELSNQGRNHMTSSSEDLQEGYFGHSQSDATSRQPNMRQSTCWHSPGPQQGQWSHNTTLGQPGSSSMGMDLSDVIQGQPVMNLTPLAEVGQNDLNSVEFHCPRTNDTNDFSRVSLLNGRPTFLQHSIYQSSTTASDQKWNASSATAKDMGVIEDSDALEYVEGQNNNLCWKRPAPSNVDSMKTCLVNYQHQEPLNSTKCLPGDIPGMTTANVTSYDTCTPEEVGHQVAFSQSPAASGLQPWMSAAPPVSTCVQQQGLSSFDTDATMAMSGFPFTRSFSAGLGVSHSGGERPHAEREALVSPFLPSESGTSSGAPFVNINTGVRHVNALVKNPDSVASPREKEEGHMGIRRDFSVECPTQSSQLKDLIRIHVGGPPYVCPLCQHITTRSSSLEVHLRTHTGEKPYLCSICGKSFRQKYHLKTHRQSHREKPHTCSVCQKAFRKPSTLEHHQRTHTICSALFKSFQPLESSSVP